jgi:outer membrane protein
MKRLDPWRALALAAVAAVVASAANAAERQLSLQEATGLALEKNETLVSAREAVAASKAAVDAAGGAYDQYLEVQGSWQKSKDPSNAILGTTTPFLVPDNQARGISLGIRQLLPTGGALSLRALGSRQTTDVALSPFSPYYGTQMGVELRQPLLRDLSIDPARFSVKTAEADRHGAQASLRQTTSETVAAVERAYWALVAARLGVEVREESVKLAEEQLQQTEIRTESGAAPKTELAQPKAELERRRGELFSAREVQARGENALKLLILPDADASWADVIVPTENIDVQVTPVDVPASLKSALAQRPELALAGAALERRHVETRFASNGVRPSLDAVASYDRFGVAGTPLSGFGLANGGLDQSFQSLQDNEFNAARVALVLGLPIRNSSARGAAESARHVERQAQAEVALVRKSIRAEVLDAAAALETAGQRIEAARSGREAAEVQLAAEKDRYDTGLSTNFLVLTRQNDLSRARLDEISALSDYRTARTELARADGTLIEQRGIVIDTKGK